MYKSILMHKRQGQLGVHGWQVLLLSAEPFAVLSLTMKLFVRLYLTH